MSANLFFGKAYHRVSFHRKWDQMRISFWFTPLLMAFFAILLSMLISFLDTRLPNEILENRGVLLSGDLAELRGLLISLATTVLATAGVVFSLLTLPLSTVASQYGSRLLRIYLGDRTTQVVLGMFTGTFSFCLFTAIRLPSPDQAFDPPQLAISFALLLFLATFASLIVLIHHISKALQAPNIVAAAGAELRTTVHELSLEQSTKKSELHFSTKGTPEKFEDRQGYAIRAKTIGYIQAIDLEHILRMAIRANLIIHLVKIPHRFVTESDALAIISPIDRVNPRIAADIRHGFQIGRQRTPTQDLEYAVNQLVEVALRAMSPAINDPFTAMTCLDYLGAGLALYAKQKRPTSHIYDADGNLRLIFDPVSFEELMSAAFDMLRHASRENATVLLKMLDALEAIGRKSQDIDRQREIQRLISLVQVESQAANLVGADKLLIQQRCEALAQTLEGERKHP